MTTVRMFRWLYSLTGVATAIIAGSRGQDPTFPAMMFGFAAVFMVLEDRWTTTDQPDKKIIMDRLRAHLFDEWSNIVLEKDRPWWRQVIRDLDRMEDLSVDNVQERLDALAAGVPHQIDWSKITRSVA